VEAVCLKMLDEGPFESAGRFEADELRSVLFKEFREAIEPRGRVVEGLHGRLIGQRDIEMVLGDIDSGETSVMLCHVRDPSLQMRAGVVETPLRRLFGLSTQKPDCDLATLRSC